MKYAAIIVLAVVGLFELAIRAVFTLTLLVLLIFPIFIIVMCEASSNSLFKAMERLKPHPICFELAGKIVASTDYVLTRKQQAEAYSLYMEKNVLDR